MRYLCNISYDGSEFFGSQKQKNKVTVLGELEGILSNLLNEEISLIASSRTDKGVHARSTYVQFDTKKEVDKNKLLYNINKNINKAIVVNNIKIVNADFHCRYDVVKKRYLYIINMGDYNPFERNYVYQYNKDINKKIIKSFCKKMSGIHNFKSFTTENYNNYERNIKLEYKITGKKLYIYIESSGFFKYMVRNIIGLLLSINEGKKDINDIEKIFEMKSRDALLKTASPNGLYLENVWFK